MSSSDYPLSLGKKHILKIWQLYCPFWSGYNPWDERWHIWNCVRNSYHVNLCCILNGTKSLMQKPTPSHKIRKSKKKGKWWVVTRIFSHCMHRHIQSGQRETFNQRIKYKNLVLQLYMNGLCRQQNLFSLKHLQYIKRASLLSLF